MNISATLVRGILGTTEEFMPRKYQNGKLEIREDVNRQYYFVRITVPVIDKETGKPRKHRKEERCGYLDETSRSAAMENRSKILEAINSHRTVIQSFILFKDLAKRYVDLRLPQYGVAMQEWERTQIRNHLNPAFGEMKLSEIDAVTVEAWLKAKADAGLSWWTRNGLKRIFSRIFNTAKAWKLWDGDNPAAGVRIGKKKARYTRRLLTVEELRTLLAALAERPRFIVLIIFGCGLAISEVLGLKWGDVDFEAKTLTVSRRWYRGNLGDTKTETRTAAIRLSDSMLAEFAQRFPGPHKRSEFVFVGDDGVNPPDDRDLGREELRPVLKRLKLYTPGDLWHAFRRHNISWRQQIGGATPFEAQKAARHASLDMTYLYSISDAERETAQQQRMFDALYGKTEGPPQ